MARMKEKEYQHELRGLHGELVALQEWVKDSGSKICIVFEGGSSLVDAETRPNVFRIAPSDHGIAIRLAIANGETFRVMTTDSNFATASVGQAVTVEGVAFPESGFLRASRVGY